MSANVVGITICLIVLSILAWDAWLYSDKVERNSITQVIIDWSKKGPAVPALVCLFLGMLIGHLFL